MIFFRPNVSELQELGERQEGRWKPIGVATSESVCAYKAEYFPQTDE